MTSLLPERPQRSFWGRVLARFRRQPTQPSPAAPVLTPDSSQARPDVYIPEADPGQVVVPQGSSQDPDMPKGKVVIGFSDGSELVLSDDDPITRQFVRAADRMMRPARWRRMAGQRVGS